MQSAEENIKVIRELMERATSYRVFSSTAAVVGALSTFAAGAFLYSNGQKYSAGGFVAIWLVVFLIVDCVNTVLLYRDSRKRGAEFPSPQMMHAVVAMIPGMLAGGVIGLVFAFVSEDLVRCVSMWVVFSGISLLGTSSFAPRSIVRLGWALLLAGLGAFFWKETGGFLPGENMVSQASFVMMATFGILFSLYALWTGVISKKKPC